MKVINGGPDIDISEAVLFPYDEFSMPFRYRVRIGMITAANPYKLHTAVIGSGDPDGPDGSGVHFGGTVIRIDDEFRMWYGGIASDGGVRMCYAVSKNGINWDKPHLGLTMFKGSKDNNLVKFDSAHNNEMRSILVLYDPDDPVSDRRFKLISSANSFSNIVAFSPDGINWVESPHSPILKHTSIEPGGLTKFGDVYLLNGHGGNVGTKRSLVTYMSYDFDNWTDALSVGLRRDTEPHKQMMGPNEGDQVHSGASLWNRGNVLLGLYGMWNGATDDYADVSIDLGCVISNDGLHFTEPVLDLQMISGYEIHSKMSNNEKNPDRWNIKKYGKPKLNHGQGFENTDDETLTWYWGWDSDFICVAKWPCDRLGYAEVVADPKPTGAVPEDTHTLFWKKHLPPGLLLIDRAEPHMISAPILLDKNARVSINADGLSEQAGLKIEVLDEQFRPMPGYSYDESVLVNKSGFREPLFWLGTQSIKSTPNPIRLKISWLGSRHEDINLYAVYVTEEL